MNFAYIEGYCGRDPSLSALDRGRVKPHGKVETLARRKSSYLLSQVDGEAGTLQDLVGSSEGDGGMADIGESDGARDNQTVDDVAKVQVKLWQIWSV